MYKLFLSVRYLGKRRIAFFGMAAVALCVARLMVVTSLFSGFISAYYDHMGRLLGDITLRPQEPMAKYEELVEYLETIEGIETARPTTQLGALLYFRPRVVKAVRLVGIDLERQCRDEKFRGGLLIQGKRTDGCDFELTGEAKDKARQWLEGKLRREVSEEELPVGAIVSIGLLADPDEKTDRYDEAVIIEEDITNRKSGMIITAGKRSERRGERMAPAERLGGWCWPVDVIQTGMHDVDTHVVYVPFDYLRELAGVKGPDGKVKCSGSVQIVTEEGSDPETMRERVYEAWLSFGRDRLGWGEDEVRFASVYISSDDPMVKQYTQAIRKQLFIMQLMLGLMSLVGALLIFVLLFMIVTQKRRDIGILRSVGCSGAGVAGLYLLFGLGIGVAGSLGGLVLGVWATRNISLLEMGMAKVMGFKIWQSGVYIFSEIPNQVDWGSVWWILISGVTASILGAMLPAMRAVRLRPIEALRFE